MGMPENNSFEITQEITILSQAASDVLADLIRYMNDKDDLDELVVVIRRKIAILRDDIYSIKTLEQAMNVRGRIQIIAECLKELGV